MKPNDLYGAGQRVTRRLLAFLFVCLLASAAPVPETTTDRLAKLSSALSAGNQSLAMESFDKSLKQYWELERNVDAIIAQADVVCAIDVIEEKDGPGGLRFLDTDWVIQLKGKADHSGTESRRERIQLEMKMVKGKWKITAMSAVKILAALKID